MDVVTAGLVAWATPWAAFTFWVLVRAVTATFGEEKS